MEKKQENKIYYGYFEDFDEPTILFSSDRREGFERFGKMFEDLAEKGKGEINLKEANIFVPGNVEIIVQIKTQATGMKKNGTNSFFWGLSPKECRLFSKSCAELARTPLGVGGGHHYLDCDLLDDVVVIASIDEYSAQHFVF